MTGFFNGIGKLSSSCFSLLLFVGQMFAATYTYSGSGGDLNVATFDSSNNPVQGVTTFNIQVSDLVFVNPGDSVMLSLFGLQYPYAGDLEVTLSHSVGVVNVSGDVFNQIGAMQAGDPGYGTQFGNSLQVCSGNYNFDSSYSGDLWATAAPLGSTDSIPCGNYFPTGAYSSNNDNLSYKFGGLPANGTWTLTVYDNYPPFNGGIGSFVPGLTGWTLNIDAPAPEPSTAVPLVMLTAGWVIFVRKRRRMRPR